jgi:hypothetical protein
MEDSDKENSSESGMIKCKVATESEVTISPKRHQPEFVATKNFKHDTTKRLRNI